MFYCPYASMMNDYYRARQSNSYIRIFHASPDAPPVDVYANGNLIAKNLTYKEFTQYIPVSTGSYNITVYPSGQTTNPIINSNIYIPENAVFNVAAIGNLPNISLYTIPEPTAAQKFGRPCIRFIHLSPNAPAVDIKLSDGTKVFNNVGYKDITDYACVPSGTYTFTVSPAGTNNVLLTVPNIRLEPDNYYTIYAVGQVGKDPTLEVIVVPEPRQ
ncbi:hypothetical protein CLHOM_23240 [Clostridium homopropionicum DSM 5847]|uniref:DUF4397 domain-containing protein n=1 Tax=Clostridium homopropionicum DSM 5847 TaxID=1121318 RepID=A0A0L6Z8X0_9CLOT|nr:DUF4397 domain-containing protein [Clostridium homopropionicum]KOA19218.1 hypothetical protein CLHOM_23240 [Clostridium homopropionicum DSM 5847]SFG17744.1 protein of unknown function [Clostridium homopropionicum]